MRKTIASLLCLFSFTIVWGQKYFDVEGRKVETESVIKTYRFYIKPNALDKWLCDSVATFLNTRSNVKKTITYHQDYNAYTFFYYDMKGRDSIIKSYVDDTLHSVEKTKSYDSLGRPTAYFTMYTNYELHPSKVKITNQFPTNEDSLLPFEIDLFKQRQLASLTYSKYNSDGEKETISITNNWEKVVWFNIQYQDTTLEDKHIAWQNHFQYYPIQFLYRTKYFEKYFDENYNEGSNMESSYQMDPIPKGYIRNLIISKELKTKPFLINDIQKMVIQIYKKEKLDERNKDSTESFYKFTYPDKSANLYFERRSSPAFPSNKNYYAVYILNEKY